MHSAGKHLWERIACVASVAWLVRASPDLDWAAVVDEARGLHAHVREFEHAVSRGAIVAANGWIRAEDLGLPAAHALEGARGWGELPDAERAQRLEHGGGRDDDGEPAIADMSGSQTPLLAGIITPIRLRALIGRLQLANPV